jgi:hypothetical protein
MTGPGIKRLATWPAPRRRGASSASALALAAIGLSILLGADDDKPAVQATIQTITGHAYSGDVTIDPRGYFVIDKPGSDVLSPVEFGDIKDARLLNGYKALKEGLILTDKSVILADVNAMDDKTVTFTPIGGQAKTIDRSRVARLQFGIVGDAEWAKVPAGKTGVLLSGGDFFEGEVTGVKDQSIAVNSLLFGPAHFTAATRAKGVALADMQEGNEDWIVWTSNGTILMADSAKIDDSGQLVVNDPWLGEFHLGLSDIQQIKAGPGRVRSLGDLKPQKIDPDGPYSYSANATPQGLALDMIDDHPFKQGVYVAAGCSVTWNLAGEFRSFSAVAGVPLASLPSGKVTLIVSVDGHEKFRSDALSSIDSVADARRIIHIDVSDAKSLTLRVEGEHGADIGGGGAFGEAALQKR